MAAVASYYANPTPAAHSHQFTKSRGHRECDACGNIEHPGQRFRMCGGCLITQYCSPDCQKRHWPSHKTICHHTANTLQATKHEAPVNDGQSLAKHLRRFCSSHQTLLSWSAVQALELFRVPANLRQKALHIELKFRNHSDPARRFVVTRTSFVSRSYVESADPLVGEDIKRREDRCRRSGGIGCAVVLIQCDAISQVMPVECDAPARLGWDMRTDWADILARYADGGRVDFQPITTTSKGIIYG